MSQRTINRLEYWLVSIMPLPVFMISGKILGSMWFFAFFMLWMLLYRPVCNIYRLRKLNVIDEREAWKIFIPLYDSRYRRELWWG